MSESMPMDDAAETMIAEEFDGYLEPEPNA